MRTKPAIFLAIACIALFSQIRESNHPGSSAMADQTASSADVLLRGPLGGATGSNGQASENGLRAPIENLSSPENKSRAYRQSFDSEPVETVDTKVKQHDKGKHKSVSSTVSSVEDASVKSAKSGAGITEKAAKSSIGLPFKAAKELVKAITP